MANKDYETLDGNRPTKHTERFVRLTSLKPQKRAIDYYRLGEVFDHVYGRPEEAQRYYHRALRQVQERKEPEQKFIVDRIADRIRIDDIREYDEVHRNLPQLIHLEEQYRATKQTIAQRPPEPAKKEDKLAASVTWTPDSQNVHDTALSDEVVVQYQKLKRDGVTPMKMADLIGEVEKANYGATEADLKTKTEALEVLKFIQAHPAPLVKLAGDTEEQLVGMVWNRTKDPANAANKDEMQKSFITNMKECYPNVCVSGRAARAVSSMAHLDKDPTMGILKTKEALRNEILGKSSIILKTMLDEKKMHEAYNAGKAPEFETEVKDAIVKMIDTTYPSEPVKLREEMKTDALAAV